CIAVRLQSTVQRYERFATILVELYQNCRCERAFGRALIMLMVPLARPARSPNPRTTNNGEQRPCTGRTLRVSSRPSPTQAPQVRKQGSITACEFFSTYRELRRASFRRLRPA